MTVADVVISGRIDDEAVTVELRPKVHFGGPAAGFDPELQTAVELAQVADAQQRAERSAAAGDFAAARTAFTGLRVSSGAALGMSRSLLTNYADAGSYAASSTMRSSSSHALSGSLAGSSDAFDALAARTIGAYTTSGQRDVALATSDATRQFAAPGRPRPTGAGVLRSDVADDPIPFAGHPVTGGAQTLTVAPTLRRFGALPVLGNTEAQALLERRLAELGEMPEDDPDPDSSDPGSSEPGSSGDDEGLPGAVRR